MASLQQFVDDRLAHGRAYFSREEALAALDSKPAALAAAYQNSSVRRLGYLLDHAGHARQANALQPFVRKAKSDLPLDPSVKHLYPSLLRDR